MNRQGHGSTIGLILVIAAVLLSLAWLWQADSGGAELPGSLPDAVRAAENSALVAQALPPGLSERYFRCKREQAARQPAAGGAMQAPAFFHSY